MMYIKYTQRETQTYKYIRITQALTEGQGPMCTIFQTDYHMYASLRL